METESVTDCGEKSDDVVVLSPTSVLVNGDLTPFDNFRFCEVDDFDFDVDLFFQLPEFGMWRNTTAKSPASITLMILPLKLGSRHRVYSRKYFFNFLCLIKKRY